MHHKPWGQVINIGSISGIIPIPLQGVYNSSKAAVRALSDALRIEMAPFGVNIICVSPSLVSIRCSLPGQVTNGLGVFLQVLTGGIKTPFFRNNSDYSFRDDSP